MHISDTLSRVPTHYKADDCEVQVQLRCHVHLVKSVLPLSEKVQEQFRQTYKNDKEMQTLIQMIMSGWPDDKSAVPTLAKNYWNFRDELSVDDELVFKGTKLLIPQKWRAEMLERIHEGHQGIEKCINRAKSAMFWIGMTKDIQQRVQRCEVCQTYAPQQQKETLQQHERPDVPWLKIGCDCFHYEGKEYLLAVDYYSNFFEVAQLKTLSAEETILKLKSIFSRNGIPQTLISDNGTNFVNDKFRKFAYNWGIQHKTSSPHYPRSNGLAERYVGIVKTLLAKASANKTDPYLALLNYLDTTIIDGKSPSQLLNGRKLRTNLPVQPEQLKPTTQADVQKGRHDVQQRQEKYYNRHARPLLQLTPNTHVMVWNDNKRVWKPAIVIRQYDARSYIVEFPDGVRYRRNRQHIKPVPCKSKLNVHVKLPPENRPKIRTSGRILKVPGKFKDFDIYS